jgi:Barstar (barnase inhibitor)
VKQVDWWADSADGIQVVSNDALVPICAAIPVGGALHCSRMQGTEMVDDGIFTQFYEHLRLPDYFGWDFDALHELLRDLRWIPSAHFLLVVDNAEHLLRIDPEVRGTLFHVLSDSADYWTHKPKDFLREKISLRTLLVVAPDSYASLNREIRVGR